MSCEHCGGEMTCVCDPLDGAIREILRLREINEELQYKNNVLNESLKTLNDRTKKAYNQLSYYENMLTIEDAPLTKLYTGETVLTVNSMKIGDLLIKYGNLRKENDRLKTENEIRTEEIGAMRDFALTYERALRDLALYTWTSRDKFNYLVDDIKDWARAFEGEYTEEEKEERYKKAFEKLKNRS